MLVLGKTALARGLAMERYAFPEIGVPTLPQSISELRGSPPLRRQRTEYPERDPIQEAVPDDMAEKDPAR